MGLLCFAVLLFFSATAKAGKRNDDGVVRSLSTSIKTSKPASTTNDKCIDCLLYTSDAADE